MKFGVYLPPFGKYADPHRLADLAIQAEKAGWDGFFIWDHILYNEKFLPGADPWVALAVIASRTENLRIGPLVTPLARRRPWKLARETVTLDHLSNGRLTIGVGLGTTRKWDSGVFGDEMDLAKRAKLLDEGLAILAGFWSGEPFQYHGSRYDIEEVQFLPTPLQQPRIPVWVGGKWPNKAPMRRAARWDGACPEKVDGELTPADWRDIIHFIQDQRDSATPFDFVHLNKVPEGNIPANPEQTKPYKDAGVTWWLEHFHPGRPDFPTWEQRSEKDDFILRGIKAGPPR